MMLLAEFITQLDVRSFVIVGQSPSPRRVGALPASLA